MEPILTNERAEREWKYLCQRVGEQRARAAIGQLKGRQRAYPLTDLPSLGGQNIPCNTLKMLKNVVLLRRICLPTIWRVSVRCSLGDGHREP